LPKTDIGWEIYPDGLFDFLTRIWREHTGDLPLYVTENGIATAGIDDRARIAYLDAHLDAARRAIAAGVPLRGYFVWSLLDNYEWSLGYDKRFGIVEVDFDSQTRRPKASWRALRAALAG
jgi:beta-glucosidase